MERHKYTGESIQKLCNISVKPWAEAMSTNKTVKATPPLQYLIDRLIYAQDHSDQELYLERVEILLQHGADPNINSGLTFRLLSMLIHEVPDKGAKTLRRLKTAGFVGSEQLKDYVNGQNNHGDTALQRVIKELSCELVHWRWEKIQGLRALLNYGADPNLNMDTTNRYLDKLIERQPAIALTVMLELDLAGYSRTVRPEAYIHKQDDKGLTPLQRTIHRIPESLGSEFGSWVVDMCIDDVKELLEHGADPSLNANITLKCLNELITQFPSIGNSVMQLLKDAGLVLPEDDDEDQFVDAPEQTEA